MPIFKHVWNFKGPDARWSEVHHQNIGDIQEAVNSIRFSMIQKRIDVLSPVCTLQNVSIMGVHPATLGTSLPVNQKGQSVGTTGGGGEPANAGEAARFALLGETGGRRFLWMRGLPEVAVDRLTDGTPRVLPSFTKTVLALLQQWAGAGYGILTRTRKQRTNPDADGYPKLITGITYKAGGLVKLTYADGTTTPAANSDIVLGGFNLRYFPWAQGVRRVVSDVNGTFIEGVGLPLDVLLEVKQGYTMRVSYSVKTYKSNSLAEPKLAIRQTKNADTGSVGARSVKGGRQRQRA